MLTAGTAQVDITPPLGSPMRGWFEPRTATAVRDPLAARAFCVGRGDDAVAVVVCDLLGAERDCLDAAKARLAAAVPLPPERMLIACTHTHEGPHVTGAYADWVATRIADAATLAWGRRAPAQIGWGRAAEPRVVFNRRWRLADGSVVTNPGVGNPHAREPLGPTDPEVGVLALRRPDGPVTGVLANYALHYIGTPGDDHALSADYFGDFARLLPAMLGGERCLAALANGASGDINNLDVAGGARPRNDQGQHTLRVAGLVAAAALWALGEVDYHADVPLGGALAEVVLEPKPAPTAADLASAQALAARGSLLMHERVFVQRTLRANATHPDPAPTAPRATWVQALRLGELALVGIPGELFCELGLEIKRRSPFAQTMVLELANDWVGYLAPRGAYEEGGYEPESSDFVAGSAEQLVEAAVDLLAGLAG